MKKKKYIWLKLNADLHGYKKGSRVKVECGTNNMPLNREWRNRVRDSASDGCVTIEEIESDKTEEKQNDDSNPLWPKDRVLDCETGIPSVPCSKEGK